MLVRFSINSPGPTWKRRGVVWRGYEGVSYLWVRSFWRCLWLWLATVAVLGFVGWGLGR